MESVVPGLRSFEPFSALAAFLESPAVPANSMNIFQLDGYLRAIALTPGAIAEDMWIPLVFNDLEPGYESDVQRLLILGQLHALYDYHRGEIAINLCNLPCCAVYARLQEERVDLEQWARGFIQGYIIREEDWNKALTRMTNSQTDHKISANAFFDEFDAILTIVSTVADAKYAVETGFNPGDLVEVFESFPDSIIRWGRLGRSLSERDPVYA